MWIEGVRSCLMKAILTSDVYINVGTCEDLKNFAFDSHPKCYVDNGFCSDILLDATNLRALFQLFTNYPAGITSNIALSLNQVSVMGCMLGIYIGPCIEFDFCEFSSNSWSLISIN